ERIVGAGEVPHADELVVGRREALVSACMQRGAIGERGQFVAAYVALVPVALRLVAVVLQDDPVRTHPDDLLEGAQEARDRLARQAASELDADRAETRLP